jgi:tetratricopeptide (TPR) repeat protein
MPNGLKDRVYYGLGAKPMPETTVNIFISAVSDEFASYRKALYKFMDGRGATVKIQERFVQNGHPTLSLLNSYIAKCDAVIHLVGDRTGKSDKHGIPGPENLKSLFDKLPDLLSRLGLTQSDLGSISYTQWEALLAIYHNKPLFIAKPKEKARRDNPPLEGEAREYQRNLQSQHLKRLRRLERHVAFEFINRFELVTHIQTNVSEILPDLRDNPAYATRIPLNFPHSIGRLFKGREGWLAKIRRELQRKGNADSCRIVIRGFGGLGKTRLALEYALACAHEHSVIHMVSGESEESFDAGLAELYGVIKPDEAKSRTAEDQRIEAIRWLEKEENKGWLLIIDNVDSKEAVERIADRLSTLRRGFVLITSRFSDWPIDFVDLKLDVLSESAGIDYLLEATDSKRSKLDEELGDGTDRQLAKILVNSLGQLALGIAQAAAQINKRKLSFNNYITQWNKNRERLLDDPDFNPKTIRYHRQLGTTWLTTYEDLPPDAKLVFDILCWLAPYPIPERLITNPWPEKALDLLEGGLRCAIEGHEHDLMVSLYDYDLASNPMGTQRLFTAHKLVQEVGRIWQRKHSQSPIAKELARRLVDREFVRDDSIENLTLQILPELRPLALHVRGMYDQDAQVESPYFASRGFRGLSEIQYSEGDLAEAEKVGLRSVELARKVVGNDTEGNINLAESLSILCQTLNVRGYFDRALEAGQEQRKILDELCTKEPENLAHRRELGIACFWVGSALAKLQRWQESAEAFEQAIKATQAVIDAGGSFGSLNADLDAMTNSLQHVRDQINKK